MSVKKIIGIGVIFVVTSVAWMILGASNLSRTNTKYSSLKKEVANLYGDNLIIKTPLCYQKDKKEFSEIDDSGKTVIRDIYTYNYFEIIKSDVSIDIALDRRKKGNLWFPTFKTVYKGDYTFKVNYYDKSKKLYLFSVLESKDSIYSDIVMSINGENVANITPLIRRQDMEVEPDKDGTVRISVSYKSTGMEELFYRISENDDIAQINDFNLKITTDFKDYDLPDNTISPTDKKEIGNGYELSWRLNKAVTGKDIGVIIPNKLNPGTIVTRVTFFAPVSLLFFFTVLFMLSVIFKLNFHPVHYFFLAATFFAFHLSYSYFSDHMNLYLTFGISSVVSLFLTVTYLRIFTSKVVSYIYAPIIEFVYLVCFSFSFFFDGMTGVIVTICSIFTLFVLMQLTGKINWDEIFTTKQ